MLPRDRFVPGLVSFLLAHLAYVVAFSWALPTPGATLAAIGATLFMVSDSLLAIDRFRRPLPHAQALIMTTYVAAQALIALSVSTG